MSTFDAPNIDVMEKSNEENIQSTKSYLVNMADNLNYKFDNLESRVAYLESLLSSQEGSE